jgi:hypothetical protein
MSDTRNVKLGVCRIVWGGVDLGYTKGGVEVEVASETHKVTVDQFGTTEINEYVMGRTCRVKVPLAETTVENLQRIMPGSTLTVSGSGVAATGSINFSGNVVPGDKIYVGGALFTFVSGAPSSEFEIEVGLDVTTSISNAVTALNNSTDFRASKATYATGADHIAVIYDLPGTFGNTFTLAVEGSTLSVSGATLSGGVEAKRKAEVTNAVGVSLLENARELVLHPIAKADADRSEDFVVPLASTAGQASFAYKVDEERIFNVEFSGYPNPDTGVLFVVGDPTA